MTLHAEGEHWIEEAGPKEIPRRRLVAATFALETARAGLDYEWANSVDLIDWGWSQLSKERPPLPAERLWHLAAMALFQGAFDESTSSKRGMRRLKSRFPNEPSHPHSLTAWSLEVASRARGFSPQSVSRQTGGVGAAGSSISGAYAKALASPERRSPAKPTCGSGYYDLIADRPESALAHLAQAQSTTTDPDVIYLAHLFRGWTLARMDRDAETTAEYQQAVDAVPAGGTGALWLARRLLLEGKRAEADAVVDRSLVDSKDVEDPWRLFGYGDFLRFPAMMKQLRGAIR